MGRVDDVDAFLSSSEVRDGASGIRLTCDRRGNQTYFPGQQTNKSLYH